MEMYLDELGKKWLERIHVEVGTQTKLILEDLEIDACYQRSRIFSTCKCILKKALVECRIHGKVLPIGVNKSGPKKKVEKNWEAQ